MNKVLLLKEISLASIQAALAAIIVPVTLTIFWLLTGVLKHLTLGENANICIRNPAFHFVCSIPRYAVVITVICTGFAFLSWSVLVSWWKLSSQLHKLTLISNVVLTPFFSFGLWLALALFDTNS